MQQLPTNKRSIGPIQAALYWVAGIAVTVGSVVLGLMLFGVLMVVLVVAATIVGGRVWWLTRKWRKSMAQDRPPPSPNQRQDDLTADYEVVERNQDQR